MSNIYVYTHKYQVEFTHIFYWDMELIQEDSYHKLNSGVQLRILVVIQENGHNN